ncbi:retinitis pigmentosa GTPase regulator b isoform X1 [Labeo rohita]|uniref:retinitis pigmentosa GTPase regulator b isoform X1 n=1 Tax=Labeo rohita TaxID=84645 RepID=UPI0021E2A1D0|nr:retinitis pigmentosa GTPase regulator b isoform X1 [Labeo rohita]
MAGETEDEIPESGAVFTFGKSKFADNAPSKFWLKNDVPLKISCGDEHTALVTENGKLFMFGSNNWGQLGLGTKTTVNKPTCVKALKSERVKLAACGRTHTLVYTSRGNLYVSGGNNEGQLGLGDCDDRTSFHLVDFFSKHGQVKMLAAGSNTSAALTQDGRLYMWGDNSEGQIGLGKESNALTPQEVSVGKRVSWVSCGYYHSAFVTVDGALFTFGEKDSGKLGLSTEKLASHKVPQQVTGISDKVVQVSCGGGHTVALTEHEVYSFGLGQFGQLGHGTFIFESRLPRVVEHFKRGRVKHVQCGENHTALITDSGLLYTFGDGRHGKLGLGEENFTNQFKPTLCPRFLDYHVHSVTCGGCHMLVLAKPRPKGSEDLILEEDDVTEDYLEKSYTELLGDSNSQATLNRSLSARVRRRERERSPDQFGQMFRTLPPLGGNQLNASLSVPSQIHHSHSKQPGKISHNSLKILGKREKSLDDRSSMEDSESVKDLGETTDLLNLTHIMKMDPSDKTLTLSPMEKKKVKVVKEHGKEKGKPRDDPALYSKRAELLARKALPTELLRSSSGSSVVGDSLGSGTPHKSPKRHGQDKENVLVALEDRNTRIGMDISRAGSKTFQPKHKQLMKSRDKVTGKDAGNKVQMLEEKYSKVEAESKKVAQSKVSTKPNQEGKTKPGDHPLEVSSLSQKDVGKEKETKMKPIIVVEQYLEQTMQQDQNPTGKKISKEILPKAQKMKGETNAAKTENKNFVPQSKKSDSKKDSKSKKTAQEVFTTSQEEISTKKTKKSKAERGQFLVDDTKKGPTIVSEAFSASESEQVKEHPLTKVTSFLQDVGMGSPAHLLGETAVTQFLSQSTPQKRPKPLSNQRTLSDVSSLSESFEVSGQEETREARRTAVTINVKAETETSDGNLERTSTESKTEVHSEVGTFGRSEEEEGESDEEEEEESEGLVNKRDESEELEDQEEKSEGLVNQKDESEEVDDGEEESEGLVNKRGESEEVDDQEEESKSKTLENDDDSEVDEDATIKASTKDEESEEEEEKSKSEATEDVESEAEESHGIEDEEEETSEISRKSEEESGEDEDESKTSEEEESGEDEDESKTSEEAESGEDEDESKASEEKESGEDEDESKTSEEEESGEDEDESKTTEEEEEESGEESEEKTGGDISEEESDEKEEDEESEQNDSENEEESEVEGESEADEDGEKTSEEEEKDSEKQESETEDEGESEREAEEEQSEEDKEESEEDEEENEEDEEEGESDEDKAINENDKEEEEEENENDKEEEKENVEEEENEEEDENEEEEEQESKDKEEEEENVEEEENEEEEATEGEEAEEEESEEAEDEEGEEEDNQEEDQEGKEEEEEQEEEEEKEKTKRKREKASESTKPKSSVKTSKQPSKAKRAQAQSDQSDEESHESKQFWDDVLPQYLNLK